MLRWTVNLNGPRGALAAVPVGHKVYTIGGSFSNMNASDQIEVNIFNTVSLRWRKFPPVTTGRGERPTEVPPNRFYHTAVLIEDTIYIWGGFKNGEFYNVLYGFEVDTHTWFQPKVYGTVPEGRYNHSACVLGKVMYVYGGSTPLTGWTNDMYKLDTTMMVWSLINTRGPPAPVSAGHFATIIGTKMFVFRGCYSEHWGRNIIVFDTETNCWLSTPSAQLLSKGHSRHSAFAYNGELYIFGGYNNHYISDLWTFNSETFSCKKVEPKGKGLCLSAYMGCCRVGDSVIVFGGYTRNPEDRIYKSSNKLFILDLSPSLKTLCKLAVIQYGLEQSELPHDIRWELAAMTTNRNN